MADWYFQLLGETVGPVSAEELKERAMTGQITTETLVRREDMEQWVRASKIDGLDASPSLDYEYDEEEDDEPNRLIGETRTDTISRLQDAVIVTTGPTVQGYHITKYLGIDGVEFVIGTGLLSEFVTDFADLFGARSKMFESKLRTGRLQAVEVLKQLAVQKMANAVIGIDFDYSEFSSNRTAIIASGTFVQVQRVDID